MRSDASTGLLQPISTCIQNIYFKPCVVKKTHFCVKHSVLASVGLAYILLMRPFGSPGSTVTIYCCLTTAVPLSAPYHAYLLSYERSAQPSWLLWSGTRSLIGRPALWLNEFDNDCLFLSTNSVWFLQLLTLWNVGKATMYVFKAMRAPPVTVFSLWCGALSSGGGESLCFLHVCVCECVIACQ